MFIQRFERNIWLVVRGRIPLILRVRGILPPNQLAKYFFQISALTCFCLSIRRNVFVIFCKPWREHETSYHGIIKIIYLSFYLLLQFTGNPNQKNPFNLGNGKFCYMIFNEIVVFIDICTFPA